MKIIIRDIKTGFWFLYMRVTVVRCLWAEKPVVWYFLHGENGFSVFIYRDNDFFEFLDGKKVARCLKMGRMVVRCLLTGIVVFGFFRWKEGLFGVYRQM